MYALHADLPSRDERLAKEADEQTWWENLSAEEEMEEIRKRDEVQPHRDHVELYVRVKNLSADVVFSDLSVQLPVPSERAEIASVMQKPLDEGPEAYRERPDYIDFCEECAGCQG